MKYVLLLLLCFVAFGYMLYRSFYTPHTVVNSVLAGPHSLQGLSPERDGPALERTDTRVLARHYFSNRVASDCLPVLTSLLIDPKGDSGQAQSALGPASSKFPDGVQIGVDDSVNCIFARLPRQRAGEFEEMCQALDRTKKEMRIHLLIVNATLGKGESFGVSWLQAIEPKHSKSLTESLQETAEQLSAQFQIISASQLVSAVVTASKNSDRLKIVSSPTASVLSGATATFTSGSEIPYITTSSVSAIASGQVVSQLNFKDVVLDVKLTPVSTVSGILLHVDERNDNVTSYVNVNSNPVPVISTQTLITDCVLEDGQAVILVANDGQTKEHKLNRLPLLGDIPVIGSIFGSTTDNDTRNQLILIAWPEAVLPRAVPYMPDPSEDLPEMLQRPELREIEGVVK